MKKLIIILFWLPQICKSQITLINDPNFERVLIDMKFDVPPIDGKVSTQGIQKIRTLDLSRKDITDITGISSFSNLVSLNLSHNPIENKKIDLSKLTHLEELDLSGQMVTKELLLNPNSPLRKLSLCNVSNQLDISSFPLNYFSWKWNFSSSKNVVEIKIPKTPYLVDEDGKINVYFFSCSRDGIRRGVSHNGKIYVQAKYQNNQLNGDVFIYKLTNANNLSDKNLIDVVNFKNDLAHGHSRNYSIYYLFGEVVEKWQYEKFKNHDELGIISYKNINQKFMDWCKLNLRDKNETKSLMEFLWSEGVAQLDCGSGENSIEYMFKPNIQTKTNAKYQVFSIFDEYFKPVFPSIDRMDEDWDDSFNYWYDKQKSFCGY
jgi:hypothetical protein